MQWTAQNFPWARELVIICLFRNGSEGRTENMRIVRGLFMEVLSSSLVSQRLPFFCLKGRLEV